MSTLTATTLDLHRISHEAGDMPWWAFADALEELGGAAGQEEAARVRMKGERGWTWREEKDNSLPSARFWWWWLGVNKVTDGSGIYTTGVVHTLLDYRWEWFIHPDIRDGKDEDIRCESLEDGKTAAERWLLAHLKEIG